MTPEELVLSCPEGTELYGGMCWDEAVRPARLWIAAAIECGKAGGRLPTLSELVAYIARPEQQFLGDEAWASDVVSVEGEAGVPLAVGEISDKGHVFEAASSDEHGYRCLFYRTNS